MLLVKTRIGLSSIHGIGLFADEDIPRGTVVWDFMPPFDLMVSEKKVNSLPEAARAQVVKYSYYDDDEGKYVLGVTTPVTSTTRRRRILAMAAKKMGPRMPPLQSVISALAKKLPATISISTAKRMKKWEDSCCL